MANSGFKCGVDEFGSGVYIHRVSVFPGNLKGECGFYLLGKVARGGGVIVYGFAGCSIGCLVASYAAVAADFDKPRGVVSIVSCLE